MERGDLAPPGKLLDEQERPAGIRPRAFKVSRSLLNHKASPASGARTIGLAVEVVVSSVGMGTSWSGWTS